MEKKQEKIGFTIGKFAPFHKGHEFLIETAINEMDRFIVFVYDTDLINVDSVKRAEWIKNKYPNVEIRFAHNPPSKYGLDKESVDIQMKYLTNLLEDIKPTHFYSSELYGEKVANYLDIVDRRVDLKREKIPITATEIRKDLEDKKNFLDDNIYNDYKNSIKTD